MGPAAKLKIFTAKTLERSSEKAVFRLIGVYRGFTIRNYNQEKKKSTEATRKQHGMWQCIVA